MVEILSARMADEINAPCDDPKGQIARIELLAKAGRAVALMAAAAEPLTDPDGNETAEDEGMNAQDAAETGLSLEQKRARLHSRLDAMLAEAMAKRGEPGRCDGTSDGPGGEALGLDESRRAKAA